MSGTYLAPGTVLRGRWEIERELGRGGYSVVYLARDREVDGHVALKLLVPPPAAAHIARERMRREVQVVRGLSHENIVAVYDFVEAEPWSFILMEYVAGPDLHVRVVEGGPLAVDQVVRLGRDLAAALGAAHRHGILHRDVKPQNVLLDPDGRYRLTDFGSARLDGQVGVTTTGALPGTPDYTAPEVLAGRRGDARADIYALGLTLHFALTGERPTGTGGTVAPAGPEWLRQVVARATASSAEDRYPTVTSLDLALAHGADTGDAPAPRCMLCDGPDPLGTGLCPSCGGSADAGEWLVFLQRGERGSSAAVEGRLAVLLPALAADARAAARGERPLVAATQECARRIVEELGQRQLPARTLRRSSVLAALPGVFYLMLLAVLGAGIAAGLQVAPLLVWITPIFAGLLLASAGRSATTPLIAVRRGPRELPVRIEQTLVATLADLPPGTARSLLADITRMGRVTYGQLRRDGDPRGAAPVLEELLAASLSAATDLAELDASLSRFEHQRDRLAARPATWMDALARCERTRDALVQRLLEAMTVLGKLQGQTADFGETYSGLAESVAELRTEAEARAAAAAEIEALLAPR
jgi:hypothetical protein